MLDADGNIDSRKLERELREALDGDIKYKQTDNMKKRACKTAGSYDEFRLMVECAGLKKLNRKDIESLRAVKKGWTSEKKLSKRDSASLLQDEASKPTASAALTYYGENAEEFPMPKNSADFERHWHRMGNRTEVKMKFLKQVGRKRVKQLLKTDCNADVFADLLEVLYSATERAAPVTSKATETPAPSSGAEDTDPDAASVSETLSKLQTSDTEIPEETKIEDRNAAVDAEEEADTSTIASSNKFKWFKALSTLQSFDLLICFASPSLRANIAEWVKGSGFDEDQTIGKKFETS